ncbi:PREDICTED: MORN repeat-containing protein 5-like isoform X2 [Polistes dominula]|uniref:MORN repeat-containing protein 5 n=1 Tax=Polistes dominula TaxID=743375 RepID=A0ABM1IGN3_POLDO|nr:PREDICTED: MORN repeat-containing protein 5-like isoform X2 [Polistes dominula]
MTASRMKMNEAISSVISISKKNVKQVRNNNNHNNEETVYSIFKEQNEKNELDSNVTKDVSDPFWSESFFVNGSHYNGTWDAVGMAGIGRYTLPNGTVFEGEFRDGKFHGHGTMSFPCGQSIDGVWINGQLKMKRYKFKDGLVFDEDNWKFCQFPDRRFYPCITSYLRPARETLETNFHPPKIIPIHCYDTGNGVYYPDTHCIMSYDSKKIIEIPTKTKAEWIINNCRKGFDEPTGYQPWLHENWSTKIHEDLNITYCLPLSNDSPQHWWKRKIPAYIGRMTTSFAKIVI